MTINNLNDCHQSAYKAGHSTESALMKITNDIQLALDDGEGVMLLLLDLSSAFDTLCHETLLHRLEHEVGVKGQALQFCKSYLQDRLQTVAVGRAESKPQKLLTGVPQGSVMGPLLFLIYMLPLRRIFQRFGVMYHG